ncbi:MAG: histidinol phosphate phosphatase domain-containing protein [Archaeoglobi archaeon]|nr:histidinol phosphate phosphatase domain-containing protein [Archaeoglobi archaeon]
MIDLHIHSVFSDGELIPSEIARRLASINYTAFAITDHVDFTNMEHVVGSLMKMRDVMDDYELKMLVGVEITHVPPKLIGKAVRFARKLGAEIVVVHGETIVEPVREGTNLSAVNEEIDILAHPGLVDEETAQLAADNGVYFEITSRKGHSLTNGHVARIAEEFGVELVVNTDSHSPSDFITREDAEKVLRGAGVGDVERVFKNSSRIVRLKD